MRERRRFIRLPISLEITYTGSGSSEEMAASSRDISEGGVCLVVNKELRQEETLDLKIGFPEFEAPLKVRGKVIWVHEFTGLDTDVSREKKFYAGVQFTEISKEDRDRIDRFISLNI